MRRSPRPGRLLAGLLIAGLLVGLLGVLIGVVGPAATDRPPRPSDDGAGSDAGAASTSPAPADASTDESGAASPDSDPSTLVQPLPARPGVGACYRLDFDEALEPVSGVRSSSCERAHTSRTYAVGRVGDLVDAPAGSADVDAPAVQRAVAAECPRRLARFLGGPEQAMRLSMFRPVWFTPSLAQAERGADWYRCDVIALASEGSLAPLVGRLRSMLGRSPAWKASYGLCATAEPGARDFERVACGSPHSWVALSTVPIEGVGGDGRRYPGVDVVRGLGTTPCTEAGRRVAEDTLDFQWGYEWPTLAQWREGRRYGVCWAPAD